MYCLLHTARAQFWLPGPDDPEIWTNQFHACRKNSDMKQYRASSRKVVLRTRAVCRAHWWVLSCTGDDGRRRTQVDLGPAEQVTCASRTEMYERQEIRSVKAAPPRLSAASRFRLRRRPSSLAGSGAWYKSWRRAGRNLRRIYHTPVRAECRQRSCDGGRKCGKSCALGSHGFPFRSGEQVRLTPRLDGLGNLLRSSYFSDDS
jgi:hypothetical protein